MKLVIHSKPCVTEKGKVMATARLDKRIDIEEAYELLKKEFKEVKSSLKLGIIKINLPDKTVIVFNSGKISIRRAENENDAIQIVQKIAKVLENI